MSTYKLQLAVPVEWVGSRSRLCFAWKSLKAGTLLDARPVEVADVLQGFVQVRVDGQDGLVDRERLGRALPLGWS